MFVNRESELAFLNDLVTRRHPGPAQLVLLYGRRRVGKTALLHIWAQRSDLPFIYWAAEKETASLPGFFSGNSLISNCAVVIRSGNGQLSPAAFS